MRINKDTKDNYKYVIEDPSIEMESFLYYLQGIFGYKEINKEDLWRFIDSEIVFMIRNRFKEVEIDPVIKTKLKIYEMDVAEAIAKAQREEEIRKKKNNIFQVNGINGDMYDYQRTGVQFLLNSEGRALLADSPGCGKSIQSLGYITHSGSKKNLIVCPASVKFSWESEIEKWTNLTSFVVDSSLDPRDIPYDVDCIIINYDVLKKYLIELKKHKFNTLVADESHLIKSPTAQRSKALKMLARDIQHVIFLTGTPVLSRPIEMFNMLNMIDPKVWNNYYKYAVEFCDGKQGYWGFEAKGATNLEKLHNSISKYFLRRTKEEVLSELPPKIPIEVPIELPPEDRAQYDLVESNLIQYLKNKKKTDRAIAKSLQAEKLVKLNLLREINAMGKLEVAKEKIDAIIEAGEKVLVFSNFNGPLKELYDTYEETSVMILGETPVEERGQIVKDFQTNPNKKVFIGGMKSAGVGITLTAASNVIILDYPWNPADLIQSEDRAHRVGNKAECINIYRIISKDTIDTFMQKLLKHKQDIIDKVIDGKIEEEEEKIIDQYINVLMEKYK